jgi:NH3-dependent NAD+ synthetase
MAKLLKIPKEVTEQEPGCIDAWLDKEVLGTSYAILDPILYLLHEKKISINTLARKYDIDKLWLKKIANRLKNSKWRMQTSELRLP